MTTRTSGGSSGATISSPRTSGIQWVVARAARRGKCLYSVGMSPQNLLAFSDVTILFLPVKIGSRSIYRALNVDLSRIATSCVASNNVTLLQTTGTTRQVTGNSHRVSPLFVLVMRQTIPFAASSADITLCQIKPLLHWMI